MPARRLQEYLSRCNVEFGIIHHTPAYTAPEVAQSAHFHGSRLIKSVMVDIDGVLAMIVIPAHEHLSLDAVSKTLKAKNTFLVSEAAFQKRFVDCEEGAIPPIGHLFGVPCYAAGCFSDSDIIAFCAGTHSELISLEWIDYLRIANPNLLEGVTTAAGPTPPKMSCRRGRMRI